MSDQGIFSWIGPHSTASGTVQPFRNRPLDSSPKYAAVVGRRHTLTLPASWPIEHDDARRLIRSVTALPMRHMRPSFWSSRRWSMIWFSTSPSRSTVICMGSLKLTAIGQVDETATLLSISVRPQDCIIPPTVIPLVCMNSPGCGRKREVRSR